MPQGISAVRPINGLYLLPFTHALQIAAVWNTIDNIKMFHLKFMLSSKIESAEITIL